MKSATFSSIFPINSSIIREISEMHIQLLSAISMSANLRA
jgi:hypothetical protein